MKTWKIILAAVVIFVAGAVTGAVGHFIFSKKVESIKRSREPQTSLPRPDFFKWMGDKLNLTPEQREKIDKIITDSHERMRPLRELIDPVMQDELKRVRDEIMKELTPEQKNKFEELMKWRPKRPEGAFGKPQGGIGGSIPGQKPPPQGWGQKPPMPPPGGMMPPDETMPHGGMTPPPGLMPQGGFQPRGGAKQGRNFDGGKAPFNTNMPSGTNQKRHF